METQTLDQLSDELQRYAGWLDRERTSVLVRSDVRAVRAALDARADPTPQLEALDINLGRLPSGDLRRILRATAVRLRRAFAERQAAADGV